jgi:excisionase family DNA binding protein
MSYKKEVPVYLSLEEAATVLSVSTRTVRRRISDGTFPAYTIGRQGTIRMRLDELEAAMKPMAHARLRPVRSGRG